MERAFAPWNAGREHGLVRKEGWDVVIIDPDNLPGVVLSESEKAQIRSFNRDFEAENRVSVLNKFSLRRALRTMLDAAQRLRVEIRRRDGQPPVRRVPETPLNAEDAQPEVPLAEQPSEGGVTNQRAAIDAFILKLLEVGRKVTRTNIWTVAGYTHPTEFERFQRGDIRNQSAAAAFNRVLSMKPEGFIELLNKKPTKK